MIIYAIFFYFFYYFHWINYSTLLKKQKIMILVLNVEVNLLFLGALPE